MPYTFQNPTLHMQADAVIVAMFEGDNEYAIIDAGSNGTANFVLVVASLAEGDDVVVLEEHCARLQEAITLLNEFIDSEYADA
jgi:hypothetical protein